jgi:hypothetical protein
MEYFELIQQQKFNIATKEMAELIKNKGLNLFLLVSINKIISNLALRNYVIDKDEYQNFSSYIKSLFGSNYKLSPELKNLLYLFYDENIYNDKMRPKLVKENGTLDQQLFEMLLYGFRFCVNTIDNSDKDNTFLFQSFFKEGAINSIKDIYIPGIDEKLYINKVNKKQFLNSKKKVRNLSPIGYRLLNFITYSHLFFGYCSGYISEEDMKKCLIEDMDILEIIKKDWNLLKELLQEKNIGSIQIFMNMIFKKISESIKQCIILDEDQLKEFENEVEEKLIKECVDIKKYTEFSEKYNEKNMEQLKLKKDYMKIIVNEILPINSYEEEKYPLFKYFNLTEYKIKDEITTKIDEKEKYPLLNQLLDIKSKIYKMKYLPTFNEFTN